MEPDSDPAGDVSKGQPVDNKATEETAGSSTAATPRRGLRERGAPRPRSGGGGGDVPTAATPPDVNGAAAAASPSPQQQSSGRVLRDRATRAVPAWLKDSKSDDEDEQAVDTGGGGAAAAKRRKVTTNSRRKKSVESTAAPAAQDSADVAAGDSVQTKDSGDSKKPDADAQGGPPSRRPPPQTRAKAPGARAARGSAKPVCKSEPGTENPAAGEAEVKEKETNTDAVKKKEEGEDADVSGMNNEAPPFQDDHSDLDFQVLQTQSGSEDIETLTREDIEALSEEEEEDVPFKDDLNDQSYDPKAERDVPSKVKRRAPPKQKDKKDKTPSKDKEREVSDIKIEGSENAESVEEEVKLEEDAADDPDGPRKRGRRRKDDKTPHLPKRRKKPPVQYVRCEMEGCGTVLAHPRYLQHHIKYQHLLKKKYVCPHPSCGRLFRLQKQLLRHAKHHTDQRDYICEFCARAFKSSHNLAVHRMIHTGEKPLQCEICGFTCRQKASLNWHMKKHDADATYQFSCSICGKKFEKKDCVVAHKAKSHPEVLIAEALAANAGALITTPASLLDFQANPVQAEVTSLEVSQVGQAGHVAQLSQVGQVGQQQVAQVAQLSQMGQVAQQVSHQVVLLGQDQSLHTMQVPVTIALSPIDPPSPAENQQQTHLQLQMPLQFVQAAQHSQQPHIGQLTLHSSPVVTQQQSQLQQQLQQPPMSMQSFSSQQQPQQVQGQTQILHMTFQPVSQSQTHIQQIPILAPQLHTLQTTSASPSLQPQDPSSSNGETYVLDTSVLTSSPSANSLHHQTEVVGEGDVVWDQEGEVLTDGSVSHVAQVLI